MTAKSKARAGLNSAPGSAAPVFVGSQIPPVAAEPFHAGGIIADAERETDWVRVPKPGQSLFGLTRSHLYQLAAAGSIRTLAIRTPGKKRGVRLLFLPSVQAYIAALDAEQNGDRQ